MKLIRNSGSERVIDLINPHLGLGHQLDFITPTLFITCLEQLRSSLVNLDRIQLILPSDGGSLELLGSDSDLAARNRLQARWLANQC